MLGSSKDSCKSFPIIKSNFPATKHTYSIPDSGTIRTLKVAYFKVLVYHHLTEGFVQSASIQVATRRAYTSTAITQQGRISDPTAKLKAQLGCQQGCRDMQSGMMVTKGLLNRLAADNTTWNPRYLQHVMQNMGKNWVQPKAAQLTGTDAPITSTPASPISEASSFTAAHFLRFA